MINFTKIRTLIGKFDDENGGLPGLLGLAVILPLGVIGLVSQSRSSLENGQKPVIEQSIDGTSYIGYDFNKVGKLDLVKYHPSGGSPRVPGYWIPINKENQVFSSLQEAYKKAQTSSQKLQ